MHGVVCESKKETQDMMQKFKNDGFEGEFMGASLS